MAEWDGMPVQIDAGPYPCRETLPRVVDAEGGEMACVPDCSRMMADVTVELPQGVRHETRVHADEITM